MRILSLFFLVAFATAAAAQQKIEIKPAEKKGLKFTRTTDISGEGKVSRKVSNSDMKLETPIVYTASTRVAEAIDAVEGGKATAVRRSYLKKTLLMDSLAIMKDAEPSRSPLSGRLITIESKDGKTTRKLSGGDADADLIAKEDTLDPMTAALASGKPVKVGDTWTADASIAKAWFDSIFNGKAAKEASLECKLEEISDKNDEKSARISIKAKMTVEMFFTGNPEADLVVTFEGNTWFGLTSGVATGMDAKGKIKGELENRTPSGTDGTTPIEIPLELTAKFRAGDADLPSADAKGTGK